MGARLIDGKAIAKAVRAEVASKVLALSDHGVVPGLTVVLVGEDPASEVYVRNKDKAAAAAGFKVETLRLPADSPQAKLVAAVRRLNEERLRSRNSGAAAASQGP